MSRIATIIVITLLSLSISTKAQEVKYGITAGFCFPSIVLSNVSENKYYSAEGTFTETYHINAIVRFLSDSWWEISLEPGFIKKGGGLNFRYETNSDIIYYENNKEYSNLELPILFNLYFFNQRFYASTGLELDYTLSTQNYGYSHNYEILPNMNNKFSISAILGISYKLSDNYDIGIRYSLGITKLVKVDLIDAANYPYQHPPAVTSIYNNCFQLSLKYNIE